VLQKRWSNIFDGLNDEQRQAVTATKGFVKEIKSKIAASNHKMDKLNKEIEELLGIEETASFYTAQGHFKLVKENIPGTSTET